MFGNHCTCTGAKPCEVERNNRKREHKKKEIRKRKERFN